MPAITPNSYGRYPSQPQYREPAWNIGASGDRFDFREDDDNYYTQPGILFREKMTPEQQQVLFANTARAISGASKETIERHIANCTKADPAYGAGVRAAIDALNAAAAEADDVAKGAANANAPVDGAPVDRKDDFADVL